MKLILCSSSGNLQIEISADQFKRLRQSSITTEEIVEISTQCGCDSAFLIEYVEDLKKSIRETIEIDGSCDYSDHL